MKTPISSLYQDQLIDLAGQAFKLKRLARWDTTATAVSKACGSSVTVDLLLSDGTISAVGQKVDASTFWPTAVSYTHLTLPTIYSV